MLHTSAHQNTRQALSRFLLVKSGEGSGKKIANQAGFYLLNGRWHKITPAKPAPKGAPVAMHPKAAGHHEPVAHFTPGEWAALKLPDSNVNAPGYNKGLDKLQALSDAGDVTGIVGSSFGTNTYGKKLAVVANHLLGLHGSQHKVMAGQKAGEHAGVQGDAAPESHPSGLPGHLVPKVATAAALTPSSVATDQSGKPIVFYHGGAKVHASALAPLTYFSTDKSVAEDYLKNGTQGGAGAVHAVYLSIKTPASDDDVEAAAKKVGIWNEYENAHQYLTESVYGDAALAVAAELKKKGFDGAKVIDMPMSGGAPITSWVMFDKGQAKLVDASSTSNAASNPAIAKYAKNLVNKKQITVPVQTGKTGSNTFPEPPDFADHDAALAWVAKRAKALGTSKQVFSSSYEYAYAMPKMQAAYSVAKQSFDKNQADHGAEVLEQMKSAGVKVGDTVVWTQTGAFLSQTKYEGKVVLKNSVPHVKLAHEVAVSSPGGKISYTKLLPWQPHMKVKGVEPVATRTAADHSPKAASAALKGVNKSSKHGDLLAEWIKSGSKWTDDPDDKDSKPETAVEAMERRIAEFGSGADSPYEKYQLNKHDFELRNIPLSLISTPHQVEIGEESMKASAAQVAGASSLKDLYRKHDVQPIIIGQDGGVVDGHHRFAAAKLNGETTIPALVPVKPGTGKVLNVSGWANGPKDGDTKPGADGGTLVLKDGRWHKFVDADEHGELPPVLVPVGDGLAMPDFQEGKTTIGVKDYYEKVAAKVLSLAGDAAALGAMKDAGLKPNAKGKVTSTWAGKTENSKKLLALHAAALGGAASAPASAAPSADSGAPGAAVLKLSVIPWDSFLLPASNVNAASINKKLVAIKAAALAGDVAALESMKFGVNSYNKKLAKVAANVVAVLKGGGGDVALAPEPIQPPAPTVLPMPAAPPAPAQQPVAALDAKLAQIPWDKLLLPSSNSNAPGHNKAIGKIKAMAEAGDQAGLQSFIDGKAGAKQSYAKKQHLLAQTALAALKESVLGAAAPVAADPLDAGPTVQTPVPVKYQKVMDAWAAAGQEFALQTMIANNKVHNPHLAAYAQKKLDGMGASDPLVPDPVAPKVSTLAAIGQQKADAKAATIKVVEAAGFGVQDVSSKGLLFSNYKGGMAQAYPGQTSASKAAQKLADVGIDAGVIGSNPYYVKIYGVMPGGNPTTAPAPAAPAAAAVPSSSKEQLIKDWQAAVAEGSIPTMAQALAVDSLPEDEKMDVMFEQYSAHTVADYDDDSADAVEEAHQKGQDFVDALHNAALTGGGPKDGDTKPGADGGTLVFKDGRWHKQASAIHPIDAVPMPDLSGFKNPALVAAALEKLKEQIKENGAAALSGATKHMKSGKLITTLPNPKKQGGQLKITGYAVTGQGSSFNAVFHYVEALKVAAGKAPAKKKAVVAPPATAGATAVTAPPAIDAWEQTGPKGGSNPGGRFKDESGVEWYCKFPADADTAKSEILAAKLYALAGLSSQDAMLVTKNGKVGIASRWVQLEKASSAKALAKIPGVLGGFAVDAWLCNRDVIGMSLDNLLIGADGAAHRVDAGGALEYRAQGGLKVNVGGAAFGLTVPEIDRMRDPFWNKESAAVFGKMTEADITASAAKVAGISDPQIRAAVEEFGPGDKAARQALADKLIARRADILARFPKAAAKAKMAKFKVENISMPPNFSNWGDGGKGLSSVEAINDGNNAAAKAAYESAINGNLEALQSATAPIYDKATHQVTGHVLLSQHPSQHVRAYWADLVNEVDLQLNPPQAPEIGTVVMDEDAAVISAKLKPVPSGGAVAAIEKSKKIGDYIVLGQYVGALGVVNPDKDNTVISSDEWKAKTAAHYHAAPGEAKQTFGCYVSTSGARALNTALRNGNLTSHVSGKSVQQHLNDFKDLLVDIPPGSTFVRRMGMKGYGSSPNEKKVKELQQFLLSAGVGTVVQEPGFSSTSWSGGKAILGNNDIEWQFTAGAGVKMYPGWLTANKGEGEGLLPPNQRYMIVGATKVGKTVRVQAVLLPTI